MTPANDSSTGGYLAPEGSPAITPLQDAALINFLQQVMVGLTGLPGGMVRPRWQAVPPNQPTIDTDWMALGIVDRDVDQGAAYEFHNAAAAAGQGNDVQMRQEWFELLCSFYGPNADANAAVVRDGLQVSQNREVLLLAAMNFVECSSIITAPQLFNTQWYPRVDLRVKFRRAILRTYPILSLLSVEGTLTSDDGEVDTIDVTQS